MSEKLYALFNFLQRNKKYNNVLQKKYRKTVLNSHRLKTEKVYSLLHSIYFTQSQPRLDNAQVFFEEIGNNPKVLLSFKKFCQYLGVYDPKNPYLSLYHGLVNVDGWGEKTSALFVKNVYQIHLSKNSTLKFWNDVPLLQKNDILYLPVDTVIKDIFMRQSRQLNTFKKINDYLRENEEWRNNDIWDDLWFWGFITQKGSKSPRALGFNKGKYWLLLNTSKKPKHIKEIEKKSNKFIEILKSR
jgi:hypothetical protein